MVRKGVGCMQRRDPAQWVSLAFFSTRSSSQTEESVGQGCAAAAAAAAAAHLQRASAAVSGIGSALREVAKQ